MHDAVIEDARAADAAAIAAIYAHHVEHGTATFDLVAPSAEEIAEKIGGVQAHGWPFLVARLGGQVAGYAYATQIRDRPAYTPTCEDSIYVVPAHLGCGLGKRLLAALIERAAASGFTQMIAVIASGEPASVALHRSLGFRHAGKLEAVGYKFGRWLDTIYMQRALADIGGGPWPGS